MLTHLLTASGIAAVVAGVVTYILKRAFDARIQSSVEKQLEKLRAEHAEEREYIREVVKKQTELYPGLVEVVHRSRNVARELVSQLPKYNPSERSKLGDLALVVTDALYATRVFLPREAYKQIHAYKTHLQQFIFDYDHLSGKEERQELMAHLKKEYEEIDRLSEIVVKQIQKVLRV